MLRFADIFIALIVISIVLLIIVPLNSFIMDLLLTVNLSISLVILLITLYTNEPLDFSIFPSLLLITTLFRLALNISSTRLILGEGEAGNVINTFGNFVIRGSIGVGFVIFMIIVVIQFIVITKGAERVAEVGARFTLDAMPGKQMAIDADLNAGLINEQEAKDRRKKVGQEADFYGAMDGASKFVKGDSIVGIIITVINIVGGICIGLYNGLSIEESVNKYVLLTVGDGLVSQIPALLISTATGIIVTRAASESNLGQDLLKQTTKQPMILTIAGGLLIVMALFPGFPKVILFILAALLIYLGYTLSQKQKVSAQIDEQESIDTQVKELKKPENIVNLLHIDPIELEFGYGIIPLADSNQGGDFLDRVIMIRRQIAMDIGLVVPVIRLRDNIQLNPNEYIIKIKNIEVARYEVFTDRFLAMDSGAVTGKIGGIDTVEPAFGLSAKWITSDEREKAELLGYTVVDAPSVIATHLTEVVKKHGHELLGRQEVQNIIDSIYEKSPTLVDELVPKILTIGEIQKVLSNLIRENIPIRDVVTIFETLADYGALTKDTDLLTEYVRQSLSRTITYRFLPGKQAKVITLDPSLEKNIMDSIKQTERGSFLAIEPSSSQKIINNLAIEVQKISSLGIQPVILTAPIVRFYFKKLTEQFTLDVIVLSYNELDNTVEVQSVGMVKI